MGKIYGVVKTYNHSIGISCAFRQWRTDTHCKFVHGYALKVNLEFEAKKLDHRNWVLNFGELKPIKAFIEDTFDHKLVIAEDDPQLAFFEKMHHMGLADVRVLPDVGCEKFAELIFNHVEEWVNSNPATKGRVLLQVVEVHEHDGNCGYVRRDV